VDWRVNVPHISGKIGPKQYPGVKNAEKNGINGGSPLKIIEKQGRIAIAIFKSPAFSGVPPLCHGGC